MSLSSTLSDLSNRFTRTDQFEKTLEFLLNSDMTFVEFQAIGNALLRNRRNLAWDLQRTPEISSHITRVRTDEARPPAAEDGGGDSDGLEWWAWLLISIAIIVGVVLIGGGGWFAYKKYMNWGNRRSSLRISYINRDTTFLDWSDDMYYRFN